LIHVNPAIAGTARSKKKRLCGRHSNTSRLFWAVVLGLAGSRSGGTRYPLTATPVALASNLNAAFGFFEYGKIK